jgi:hypothetical protein
MMKLNITSNFADFAERLAGLGRQAPFVAAVSLTRTAKDVQLAEREEIVRAFDRPVPYTLNSTFLKAATKSHLEAKVWLKDNPFGKGTPADRYLAPQIFGGPRRLKGMERALAAVGLLPAGHYAVPAAGAQMDANGNVKRSQIIQIMSQLKVQERAGYQSRATGSARSRRTVAKQGVTYFALPQPRRGLAAGIYMKRQFAHGSAIKPVFIFTTAMQYQKRLRFFEVGDETARQRFPEHFQQAWAKATAEAKVG